MDLKGQTALVTGGAVRIGAAICRALAAAGARVVIHCRRSVTEAARLREELEEAGGESFVVTADLDRGDEAAGLVARAVESAGPLDILVNNAAVFTKETLDAADAAALASTFQANLFAPLLLMRAFAGQGRRGQIVNLLDRRIRGWDTSCAPYALSKKALAEATRLAALTWAPRLRVNAVAPGPVLPPPGEGPDHLRERAGFVPLGRPCAPAEVADAVLFLLRNDALTGQVIFVDGGQHLALT